MFLSSYRSVSNQQFDVGPFTVLFGKNNAGKTNLLEAMYGAIAPDELPSDGLPARGMRGQSDPDLATTGVVYVDLEPGLRFDDGVLEMVPRGDTSSNEDGVASLALPPRQVCFASVSRGSEVWFVDLVEYVEKTGERWVYLAGEEDMYEIDERYRSTEGPRPRPLFLGWDFDDLDRSVTSAIAELRGRLALWLVPTNWLKDNDNYDVFRDIADPDTTWQIAPDLRDRMRQLELLASSLLPDFIEGCFHVELKMPIHWENSPFLKVTFTERGGDSDQPLSDYGRGVSRWLAVAVQVALHVMNGDEETTDSTSADGKPFSGQVLFVDEPEAHLHPFAVASVVRWCQRLVRAGFTIVAASHHEEFLRASGSEISFVKVTRGADLSTTARTVTSTATPVLQELAAEIGMHPAAALSLHRAVLFVEGTLDEAVLEEYAGLELDAAGVSIVCIHGTKNLEGLIDGEFTTRLGIKVGVLTDNTSTATIWERSNRKRSSEEVKLVRLIKRFEEQGLMPPEIFGVSEDDLLFALPEGAVRDYLQGPFPGWHELREECRSAEGKGASDSVDWKSYAERQYGLPITTPSGVKSVVRALDLAGVAMPSIRAVVDEVIAWAAGDQPRN